MVLEKITSTRYEFMNRSSNRFVRLFAFLLAGLTSLVTASAQSVTYTINNHRDQDVYMYFDNTSTLEFPGPAPSMGGIKIDKASGNTPGTYNLDISYWNSGRLVFSIGELPGGGSSVANFANPNLTGYSTRFDKVETNVNYAGSTKSTNGSFTNLTATDFTGVPISLGTSANPSAKTGWVTSYREMLGKVINNSVDNKTPNTVDSAIVTGTGGVNVPGVGDVIRIISPSTAVANDTTPYASLSNYLTSLNGTTINLDNTDLPSLTGGIQTVAGTVTASNVAYGAGDVVFANNADFSTATEYLIIPSSKVTTLDIYKASSDPSSSGFDVTSNLASATQNNVLRDFVSVLNIGAAGSQTIITGMTGDSAAFNGMMLGDLTSGQIETLSGGVNGDGETGALLFFFQKAHPTIDPTVTQPYWNEYLNETLIASDNTVYGFPFNDFLGAASPTNVAITAPDGGTIFIDILTDDSTVVPEPASASLLLGAGLVAFLRRRRARQA